ncbi:hypothetical protein LINPERHAP1_LOCUS14802 [Linum perenne]
MTRKRPTIHSHAAQDYVIVQTSTHHDATQASNDDVDIDELFEPRWLKNTSDEVFTNDKEKAHHT